MAERSRRTGVGALKISRRKGAPTRRQLECFLDGIAETANVSAAAAVARIDCSGAYKRRKADPVFAALWEEALDENVTRLEARVMEAALAGAGDVAGEGAADTPETGEGTPKRKAPRRTAKKPAPVFDPQLAMRVLASRDARLRRAGPGGGEVALMPIDEVERILLRRIAAVEKRLAGRDE